MKTSAGLLMYRRDKDEIQFFLVHPGGPFWKNRHEGSWSIPKGEFNPDEIPLNAAIREFTEETGKIPEEPFFELGIIRQKSGKQVYAWAFESDFDPSDLVSNIFTMEWPPRSGKKSEFPEVDRGGWFNKDEAEKLVMHEQLIFIERLLQVL